MENTPTQYTKTAVKSKIFAGNTLGVIGIGLTSYQLFSKYNSGQEITTNDKIDFGVNMTLGVAGLLALNPVGFVIVGGLGLGYGIYTVWRDNGK